MASYRYCRSDDVPLLVRAYNDCFRVHFPDASEMTVERFKRLLREIDLWAGSCMVASENDEPIGVVMATKRDDEALIFAVGIRPGHERRGHGRHMLDSLSRKQAILGPPRMVAEVPQELIEACAFMEACGYHRERAFTDFVCASVEPAKESSPFVIPVSVDDLRANDLFDMNAERCWERSPRTIVARAGRVRGLGVASDDRIEAWMIFDDTREHDSIRILAFAAADAARAGLWFDLLLRHVVREDLRPIAIERVRPEEIDFDLLHRCGFETGSVILKYVARPLAG